MTRRHERHGRRAKRLYSIWKGMKQRCSDPAHVAYGRYGGKGVKVCDAWQSFSGFESWALANGYRINLTIDRVDGDGDYTPENCRWATPKQQAANSAIPRVIEAFGEAKNVTEWAEDERCPVTRKALTYRLAQGWPVERAITQPNRQGART